MTQEQFITECWKHYLTQPKRKRGEVRLYAALDGSGNTYIFGEDATTAVWLLGGTYPRIKQAVVLSPSDVAWLNDVCLDTGYYLMWMFMENAS